MRKTISTALTAALFSPVVMFAACISGGTIDGGEQVEDTLTSKLPLSEACGDCAQDALATTCAAALDACVNTPDCLDVSGCLDACEADDVACFAGCVEASAMFLELTDCVLCNTCAQECANDWTCAPNDPPDPDPQDDCGLCILTEGSPECQQLAQSCIGDDACMEGAQCIASCGLTDECVQQCTANVSDETALQLLGLAECANSDPCAEVCAAGPDDPPDPPGDPSDECLQCGQEAALNECPDQSNNCLQTEGCTELIECWTQCTADEGCLEQCAANISDEAFVAAQEVLSCALCEACPQQCGDVCQ